MTAVSAGTVLLAAGPPTVNPSNKPLIPLVPYGCIWDVSIWFYIPTDEEESPSPMKLQNLDDSLNDLVGFSKHQIANTDDGESPIKLQNLEKSLNDLVGNSKHQIA